RANKSIAARRTAVGLSSTTAMGSEVGVSQIFFYCRIGLGIRSSHQQLVANLLLDLTTDLGILFQVLGRIGLALTDLAALVGVPGTGLLYQPLLHAQINDL